MTGKAVWVTANFINPSKKPGGKFGSISTPEEKYISVPVSELGQFRKGGRYCVEIEVTPEGYKNFVRFANAPPSGSAQPQRTVPPVGDYAAARASLPPRPQSTVQARPAPIQPYQTAPYLADPQALAIFVTGVTGRALGSGHFTAQDIPELVREAKAAFMLHLSGNPDPVKAQHQPVIDPQFDDPIPFGREDAPTPDPDAYGAVREDIIPY